MVTHKIRNPVPTRVIYAAVRESSPTHLALHGLRDALREAATTPRPGR
ncbi:hypothetical protein ACIBF5_07530 [Micromonospora sp. NPDC050417]